MPTTDHAPMHLEARAGAALTIELAGMPGAGLVWQAPAAPAGCTLTEGDAAPAGAGVGGAVGQRFVLVCSQPGRQSLRFELKRPWEPVVRAVQPVVVEVR